VYLQLSFNFVFKQAQPCVLKLGEQVKTKSLGFGFKQRYSLG